jgi:hypothetical protein
MGSIVGVINASYGLLPASYAAAKQGAYTFFFAGLIMQFCRWLALRDYPPAQAIFLATAIPTAVTGTLIVSLHVFSGTPAPLLSSLPPVTLGLISFFILSRSLVFEE